ncbi:hypothetical protein GSI_03248 [Ganoderma sinense ZZ0214-1]|uniref:Uncharacterized protein n=1 Tax=Ganoderma sinense ZZ0214-1 TaxID=1077348 RepID=A0A2G8SL41_9APHY|nr:hypothetical protein GSI_03248 [Ganoderma sinense ZZ0214-1]
MLAKRTVETSLIALAIVALGLNAIFKFAARSVIDRAQDARRDNGGIWNVERKEVALQFDSWTRYQLDSSQQWAPLFPEGGIIHLGPTRTPYTVSMMHQLRCLDVIRDQLNRPKSERDAEPTRHCLNYVRQMATCRGDLQFDPIQYPHKVNALHPHAVRRCRDWRAVYDAVWKNQQEHRDWLKKSRASNEVGSK